MWNVIPSVVSLQPSTLERFAILRSSEFVQPEGTEVVSLRVGSGNREVQNREDRAIYQATYRPSFYFQTEAEFTEGSNPEDLTLLAEIKQAAKI